MCAKIQHSLDFSSKKVVTLQPKKIIFSIKGVDITTIYLILLCIGASFIQRTTGFGFGIFIMSMLIHLVPSYGEAVTLSGMLALTTSLTIALRLRKLVVWKRLLPMLITFIIVSSICIFFLTGRRAHTYKHLFCLHQQAHHAEAFAQSTGGNGHIERTYGWILRHARTACRALFHLFRGRQAALHGYDTSVFRAWKRHDDCCEGAKRIPHINGYTRLFLWFDWSGCGHSARSLCLQPHSLAHFPLCGLRIYRNQRRDDSVGNIDFKETEEGRWR